MNRKDDISNWQHDHNFHTGSGAAEKRTWIVVAITSAMMIVELIAGWLFNSMAVLADGWHMSTHAVALSLTGFAYLYSRRSVRDRRFAFGPWKIEALGGYTSAVLLVVVALFMVWQSVQRIFQPLDIRYDQALIVAVVGLIVNIVCALILREHDDHDSAAGHDHHGRHDLNLKAAYLHVMADALTSVLAIIALLAGRLFHFRILDPLMGIVGGVLISVWAYGLLRDASRVLLDREMDHEIVGRIRRAIEADSEARISDLHVWRIGKAKFACALAIVEKQNRTADDYRVKLKEQADIAHLTIEVIHEG